VPKIRKTYIAKVVVTISNVYDAARWERASESDDDTKWDEFANNQTGDGIEEISLYVEVLEDEKVIEDILDKSADSIKEGLIADGVVERNVFEQSDEDDTQDDSLDGDDGRDQATRLSQLEEGELPMEDPPNYDERSDGGTAYPYGGESMDDTLAKVNVLKHS
jgi:hypothetical protein